MKENKDIHELILEYLYQFRDTPYFVDVSRKFSSYSITTIRSIAINLESEGYIKIDPQSLPPKQEGLGLMSISEPRTLEAQITFKGINHVKSSNVKEGTKQVTNITAENIGNLNTGSNNTVKQTSNIKKTPEEKESFFSKFIWQIVALVGAVVASLITYYIFGIK